MCSDGVGRTGAFISTHAEMERMKAETVVDLFQFIKAARTQRKGLVSNKVRDEHAAICSSIDLLWSTILHVCIGNLYYVCLAGSV